NFKNEKIIDYNSEFEKASEICECESMEAESPLFILYTSGSTGKPKGLLHTTAGYGLYTAITHKYVFDYKQVDIYFCTADIGWITGHSYIIYGPLINGATTLMFEGVPTYPDASRFWNIVDKHKVTQFYTAPTAIRMLMGAGDDFVNKTSRKSLRILGSVGEPINPEAWRWYHKIVGNENCPIVDTWWQTETGGFLITPLPYATKLKAGSATKPFFGVIPAIVNDKNEVVGSSITHPPACGGRQGGGQESHLTNNNAPHLTSPHKKGEEFIDSLQDLNPSSPAEGNLCILNSWPSQARTIWGDHQRFVDTYFKPFAGKYFSGDGAKLDEDGDFWITGRVDDVINVSGHRLGTAEIESALVLHPAVAEAAVVGYPHDIKGQGIYAFVTLKDNVVHPPVYGGRLEGGQESYPNKNIAPHPTSPRKQVEELLLELKNLVAKEISAIAKPDLIQFVTGLPKTRSGKIMRRILRKIAENNFENLGDTKTLLNPEAVDEIINNRLNKN
ncbi:MAG: AMP-binding protein, partial [Rickettsiales bacterium]|nr:AMP-binding protein [Rickettsiales bacterium]